MPRQTAARLDDLPLQRAALFVACLAGISILRDVLRVEPLLDTARREGEPLVARLLDACLDDVPGSDPLSARSP